MNKIKILTFIKKKERKSIKLYQMHRVMLPSWVSSFAVEAETIDKLVSSSGTPLACAGEVQGEWFGGVGGGGAP